jgi:hypothetical protein
VAIRNKALKGASFRYGGEPSIISMAMMPNDQMSTFLPVNKIIANYCRAFKLSRIDILTISTILAEP